MVTIEDHPTVRKVRSRGRQEPPAAVDPQWLREIALAAGADDVGFASLQHPELTGEVEHAHEALPGAAAVVGFVVRMNRESVRSTARSVANLEFHHAGEQVNDVAHRIVRQLEDAGIRALNPSATFPQEMDRFPGRAWVLSLKTVAVAAGLGSIGLHRNVIHPRWGSFVLLGAVVLDTEIAGYDTPLDYNPCVDCKLCVSACPVGAITAQGEFDFQACYTHNYREFMSGFTDFMSTVADADDRADYRDRVSDAESASMWQSLAFKPNYKAAYCMAVCPAGEDVLGPFLDDRRGYRDRYVTPLQTKAEPVYVLADSYAEEHVTKRFKNKTPVQVDNGFPEQIQQGLEMLAPRHASTGTGE